PSYRTHCRDAARVNLPGSEAVIMSDDKRARTPAGRGALLAGERLGKLSATLDAIEAEFRRTPSPANDPGYAERAAAGAALKAVMKFFWAAGIERRPLSRLEDALVGVSNGQQPVAMLCPPLVAHRRGDRLAIQAVKAELAAIMEIQQRHGRMERK